MKLSAYLEKSIEGRTLHLDPSEPHLLHPVEGRVLKIQPLREQMFERFGITELDMSLNKCHICHRCDEPNCRNIYHTYIGTAKENFTDRITEGSYRGEGEFYNNGFYSVKWTDGMPPLPKDFVKGRLKKTNKKVSKTRLSHGIKKCHERRDKLPNKSGSRREAPRGVLVGIHNKDATENMPTLRAYRGREQYDKIPF